MIKILFFVEEENTTHIISNYMARIIFASDFPSPRINSKPLAYIYIYTIGIFGHDSNRTH